MRKIKVILLFISLFMLNVKSIVAECDNKTKIEINTSASNVQANLNFESKIIGLDGNEHPEVSEDLVNELNSGYVKADIMYIYI